MTMRPVIFDMDGVLADSEGISCEVVAKALSAHGANLSVDEVKERFVGMSTQSMLKTIQNEQSVSFPSNIREIILKQSLSAYQTRLKAILGMPALIQNNTFPRCVASSSSPERIEGTLKTIGLFDTLSPHLFSATMVKNGKPAPDLFLYAAAQMNWQPLDCVIVEDSKAGVEAGVAADMTVIGITAGEHLNHATHAPKLTSLGAHKVVENVEELAFELRQLGVAL